MGPGESGAAIPPELRHVLEEARSLDLLGSMELEAQMDHALGFAHAFEALGRGRPGGRGSPAGDLSLKAGPRRWMDLGSGGGLPGLVLAQYWPESSAVLLDAAERRTAFLAEVVHRLGWDGRVQVIRARAEAAGWDPELRGGFEAVWARSFGSPPVTAECAAPFLRVGGLLVVSEPPPDQGGVLGALDPAVVRWPREGLAPLGLEPVATLRSRFGYQVLGQVTACPERFPRRAGVAAKRPLYRVADSPETTST